MLGAAGVHAAAHLPLCQQTQQVVGWEHGQPCVSRDVAVQGATAWRYTGAPFHLKDQLDSWRTGHHQVLSAPDQAAGLGDSRDLKVVSWNLHHGLSQDATGARPQLDTMIENLQEENADLVLLQEVQPGHALKLTEALGMQGYYAMSTPVQGNMILLRPDIQVRAESVTFTTGQPAQDPLGTLKDWVTAGGGPSEPRNVQILKVEMPDGQAGLIWNTHHLTGDYSLQQKQAAADTLVSALRQNLQPGEWMVGGGDLNASGSSSPLVAGLSQLPGVTGQQRNIDWIYASDSARAQLSGQSVESGGVMVSDHPLVRADLTLPEKV